MGSDSGVSRQSLRARHLDSGLETLLAAAQGRCVFQNQRLAGRLQRHGVIALAVLVVLGQFFERANAVRVARSSQLGERRQRRLFAPQALLPASGTRTARWPSGTPARECRWRCGGKWGPPGTPPASAGTRSKRRGSFRREDRPGAPLPGAVGNARATSAGWI